MGLFDRDYDRAYGSRGTSGRGYDRGLRGSAQYAWRETKDETSELFGRDYDRGYRGTTGGTTGRGYRGTTGYARGGAYGPATGYGTTGYDRGYTGYGRSGYADDYGAGYKSRAQTDTGDPFGDRQSGTPIRVMDEREDEGWFGGWGRNKYDRGYGYDRGYRTGYDRTLRGGYDRSYGQGVGHDAYTGRGTVGTTRKVNEYEGQHRMGGGTRGGFTRGTTRRVTGGGYDNWRAGEYDRGWF